MPTLRKSHGRILTTKTKDLGHGVVSCIVSTNTKDRHGEILDIKSLDTKQFSGVVFLNHDYQQLPIGKSLGLKKTADGKLVSKTQFAIDEFDLANTVYKLVAGGYMPDVSIGFIPKEFDPETNTWNKAEMIEYSHVGIGANPEAKVQKGLEAIGLDADEFKAQIKEHMKVVKGLEPDEADPPEEPEVTDDEEAETKAVTKGAVANVLLEGDKYEYMEDFWEVIYAFCDAYYSQDAAVSDFTTLLQECVDILQTIVNGNYAFEDEDDGDDDGPIGMKLRAGGVAPLSKAELVAALGKKLDSNATGSDNELEYIATLKRLINLAETELKSLPPQEQKPQKELRKKRVLVLRSTKKTINSIDRVAELATLEIKKRIGEELQT